MDVSAVEVGRSLGDRTPAGMPGAEGAFADLLSTEAKPDDSVDRDLDAETSDVGRRQDGRPAEGEAEAEVDRADTTRPRPPQPGEQADAAADPAPSVEATMESPAVQGNATGASLATTLHAVAAHGMSPGEAGGAVRPNEIAPARPVGLEAGQPNPVDAAVQAARLVAPLAPGRQPLGSGPFKPIGPGLDGKPVLVPPGPADDLLKPVLRGPAELRGVPAGGSDDGTAGERAPAAAKRAVRPGSADMPGRLANTFAFGDPTPAGTATTVVEPAGASAPGPSVPTSLDQPAGTALTVSSLTASSESHAPPGSRAPSVTPGAAEQIAVQIRRAADSGQSRVTIRLHPADLGRVDVSLQWSEDGALRALLTADKSETLDLLQRDARELARALQEAGLKSGRADLSFDLRSDGHDPRQKSDRNDPADDTARDPSEHLAELDFVATGGHDGLLDLTV